MSQEFKAGSGAKGDCLVVWTPADERSMEIKVKDAPLVERGIRQAAQEALLLLGNPVGKLFIADQGAVDYVLQARIEVAVRSADPSIPRIGFPELTRPPVAVDRLRRTRSYAPGNNPRLLAGVELHGADVVLLDLEDSVPPSEKQSARLLVKHLLAALAFDEVWVRINPFETFAEQDLPEVMQGRPHGICLPKTESASDIHRLAEQLTRIEQELGITPGSTFIVPILETARGVHAAPEIAAASPRVVQICFGAEDYTRDIGARRIPEVLLFPRCQVIQAARMAGVQASDTVYPDVDDDAGLRVETELARDLGFDGKGVINPRQIETVHAALAPTRAEIDHAVEVVKVAREAERQGLGAVAIGGKMIDRPVLERARRTLELARLMHLEVRS